jgi:hypothetical protein
MGNPSAPPGTAITIWRESALPPGAATLPTSGSTPKEDVTFGDQPVAVSPGDAGAAFRCLYAEHGPALLQLSIELTGGDRGRGEDLVQETMLRAWTRRNNVDIQHRPPWAWLIT